jgi:hypothetical protein
LCPDRSLGLAFGSARVTKDFSFGNDRGEVGPALAAVNGDTLVQNVGNAGQMGTSSASERSLMEGRSSEAKMSLVKCTDYWF